MFLIVGELEEGTRTYFVTSPLYTYSERNRERKPENEERPLFITHNMTTFVLLLWKRVSLDLRYPPSSIPSLLQQAPSEEVSHHPMPAMLWALRAYFSETRQGLLDPLKFSESIFFLFNLLLWVKILMCESRAFLLWESLGSLVTPAQTLGVSLLPLTLTTYQPGHSGVRQQCFLGVCTCNFLLSHSLFTCFWPLPTPRVCPFLISRILIIQLYPLLFLPFSGYSGLNS